MDDRILRVLRGEASEIEARQVERWCAESEMNAREFDELAQVWKLTNRTRESAAPPSGAQLRSSAEDRRRKSGARDNRRALIRSPWVGYGVAAAAVVMLAFLGLGRRAGAPGVGLLAPVGSTALTGGQSSLTLSDGSTVRLAPATRVDFPNRTDRREVVLEGRAFFAVAEGPTPFVVHTDQGAVTVHGTRFEVSTEGDATRVTVVEGRVSVENAHGSVRVTPGQVVRLSQTSAPQVTDHADVWSLLDWPSGLLVFQATPLALVASELERHFAYPVQLDSTLAGRRVTAWFDDEPIGEVVDAICMIAGATCVVGDSTVAIGR